MILLVVGSTFPKEWSAKARDFLDAARCPCGVRPASATLAGRLTVASARSDNKPVSAPNLTQGLLFEGAPITVVEPAADAPAAFLGVIKSLDPLQIRLEDDPRFSKHAEVLMIVYGENRIAQAKGHVERIVPHGGQYLLEIAHGGWNEEDRRRHERVAVDLRARVVSIREGDCGLTPTEVDGRFTDISLSGGWFASENLEPRGSLVRWQAFFEGTDHPISGLAIVARSCPKLGGMALEFVEFFSGTRELLRVKLRSKSA